MSKKKINIAIIGATGYTGLDLIYLLCKHPKVEIKSLCATKNLGKDISFFDKRIKRKLPKITSTKKIVWKNIDLVFLSLPNGEAQKLIKKVYYKYINVRFIDLSADFRITDFKKYKLNYNIDHKAKDLIKNSIYSVSELVKKDISKYRIIANPGCYPTSVQIPLVPLIKKKLIKINNLFIDSKSGYSGAGKNLKNKFSHKNLFSSIHAYGVNGHKHIVEIEQELKKYTKSSIEFTFNPHLLPTFRGILTSIYLELNKKSSTKKVRNELIKFYKKKQFIKILKLNSNLGSGNVLNTNNCEISVCNTRIKKKIVIFSAIDNLVKGASGQAVQNMNLIYKFPESLGLK
tara:strand:- start:4440 stop:5474 length:1035 start_codon:yes stop_codon:yes gene_type:complete